MANNMRMVSQIFFMIVLFISCTTNNVDQDYFKKYIGGSISEIIKDDSINFKNYSIIDEPPGVGRGIICESIKGQPIYIYIERKEAVFDDKMNWKLEDFKEKIISGIAIKRNSNWQIFGSVIKYFHQ